jgi:ATP synthase protein I
MRCRYNVLVKVFTSRLGASNRAVDLRKRGDPRFDSLANARIYSRRPMADRPNPDQMWGGMSTGIQISAYLLSAIVVFGGLGYLIDWLVGTEKAFTAAGMVVGSALGIYLVYLRYGRGDGGTNA